MAIQSSTGAIGRSLRTGASLLDVLAPGGTLEWLVSGSGLGGISDLRLLDTLGDGQRLDTTYHPQVTIRRGFFTLYQGELQGWSATRNADTATTAISFDLAPTLRAAGLPDGLTDDATVEVTFRSTMQPLYAAKQGPSLGRLLGQGDPLRNAATFSGTMNNAPASSDPVAGALSLPGSVLSASVYAVNGALVSGPARAAFGDVVTYRMQLMLPLSSAHQVRLLATAPGLAGAFVFDARGGPTPPPGHAQFGPASAYTATRPVTTAVTDAAGNAAVQFDLGDIQPVYGSGPGTIDLLVSAPLAPGAPLAFTATETEANSFGAVSTATAPSAGITLNEPSLRITTATLYASNDGATWTGTGGPFGYSPFTSEFGGIISSAGLAGEPFNDCLFGVDAGDEVTFVIAVENLMPGAKAYDLVLRAAMPDGFVAPGGDAGITVTDGAGTPMAFSGDLFDPGGGLSLGPAAVAGFDANSGLNVLLVSYTLRSTERMDVGVSSRLGTAQIVQYATQPGWANRRPLRPAADSLATTEVRSAAPVITVAPIAAGSPGAAGTPLVLGNTATFQIVATLPEGLTRGLDLYPVLPPGVTVVSSRVVSVGANVSAPGAEPDGAGGIVFGDTINAPDGQSTADDQVRIEVTVRPTKIPDGPAPRSVSVGAAVRAGTTGAGTTGQVGTATVPIAIALADPLPPLVTLALAGGAATLLSGQVATFRAAVTLPPGLSTAFRILDLLPAGLAYLPGSARVVDAGGVTSNGAAILLPAAEQVAGALLVLDFGAVSAPAAASRQVVVELQARVAAMPVGTALVSSVTAETGYASSAAAAAAVTVGNTAPVVTGLLAAQAARDDTALTPFIGIAVADPDPGQRQTLQVTLSNPANGVLVNGSGGSYDAATGAYSVTGTAAEVAAAVAALRFQPARRRGSLGQQVQTDLIVQAQDSAGAAGPAAVTRVTTTVTNTAPIVRNAAAAQAVFPGVPVRLFTGLRLEDADAGQVQTLLIRLADPAAGVLSGTGRGRYDPASGVFTSTGTPAALMAEAANLLFTAASRPAAADIAITITLDDGAGGVARDTATIAISASTLLASPFPASAAPWTLLVPPAGVFIGPAPANVVVVPAGTNLLAGTVGRDAYLVDGAAGPQWDTLAGFGGGDAVVLWGFRAGLSSLTWSDGDGPSGQTGRTLRASMSGAGSQAVNLTFAGRTASDTDRFAVSTGRWNGLDYLLIASSS